MSEIRYREKLAAARTSPRTVNLESIPANEAQVLSQVLHAALASAGDMPVMFAMDEYGLGMPTPGEITHAEEILKNVLNYFIVHPNQADLVARCILFMIETFDNITIYGSDMPGQEIPGREFILRFHGIDYTEEFRTVALKYAQRLIEGSVTTDIPTRITTHLTKTLNIVMGRIMFEQRICFGDVAPAQYEACEQLIAGIARICEHIIEQQ